MSIALIKVNHFTNSIYYMVYNIHAYIFNYFMAIMFRYHFFLQLKMDVIEGRILCDADQAVLLASYSMQGSKKYTKPTLITYN